MPEIGGIAERERKCNILNGHIRIAQILDGQLCSQMSSSDGANAAPMTSRSKEIMRMPELDFNDKSVETQINSWVRQLHDGPNAFAVCLFEPHIRKWRRELMAPHSELHCAPEIRAAEDSEVVQLITRNVYS